MGRKGSWFSSLKKALSPNSKGKKHKRANNSDKEWIGEEAPSAPESSALNADTESHPHPLPPAEEFKPSEVENDHSNHAQSVAVATAAAAAVAAQATAEVVQLTVAPQFRGKSEEEVAVIRIQTAFRGHLARRALQALRGLVRLKTLVDGSTIKRQTANTLKCMQTLSRVQAQICYRRTRMLEENRALQKQLMQKHAQELESLRLGEEWDDSLQSKEQIEANLLHKYEAAMRRERALAYSYSHQQRWKKSSRSSNLLFMDPTNPDWGWSWLERWMAARPWESQSMAEKESNKDHSSVKSASYDMSAGEVIKAFARHQLNSDNPPSPAASQKPNHPFNRQSPSTPSNKPIPPIGARKLKSASPKVSTLSQDDTRSVFSMQSERNRRHSIAGSSVRDDESLAGSPSVRSYMASTHSAKAKTRLQSPSARENGTPEKGSAGLAKKRLSFPASPARLKQHSGPPKLHQPG